MWVCLLALLLLLLAALTLLAGLLALGVTATAAASLTLATLLCCVVGASLERRCVGHFYLNARLFCRTPRTGTSE